MGIDTSALVKTLNKTCRNSLEAAAGLTVSKSNYSVEIEHWLLKLIEANGSDINRLLRHFEINAANLQRDLSKAIEGLRTGNDRNPTLSPLINRMVRRSLGAFLGPVP